MSSTSTSPLAESSQGTLDASPDELPVVARLVIEIRSDGTRTIARGAAEDEEGQRVAIQAEGATPLALALSLARSLSSLPGLAATTLTSRVRSLLPRRRS